MRATNVTDLATLQGSAQLDPPAVVVVAAVEVTVVAIAMDLDEAVRSASNATNSAISRVNAKRIKICATAATELATSPKIASR